MGIAEGKSMILKGKPVADRIKENIIKKVAEYSTAGLVPKLNILRVGKRPDDITYEERVLKNCLNIGIEGESIVVDEKITTEQLLEVLERLNMDDSVHGILIFRPLPKHIDEDKVCRFINPLKDIDCMNPTNTEKVFTGDKNGFAPCTPEAVIEILKFYGYNLIGKNVVIVNRSMVLGKPLAMMFLGEDATVTICHSKTKDLRHVTSAADIVVSGIGKGNFFTPYYFNHNSVVIDVGINFLDDVMCGDVEFDSVSERVQAITPVPGGVGTVTSVVLLQHVIKALELQRKVL